MTFSADDRRHMARALELAERGLRTTHPNPRVGCVLAAGADVIAEGWHVRAGGPHAEVDALARAGTRAKGATAYVTLEPCCHAGRTPPCTDALIQAGVRRVVYGASDPNPRVNGGGERALRAAGIDVEGGLLAAGSERLNAGFMLRMRRGWPLVRVKIAASLDGRTALADGRSQWITGEPARRDVQRWRARSAAILTGVGTVLADDPGPERPGRRPGRLCTTAASRPGFRVSYTASCPGACPAGGCTGLGCRHRMRAGTSCSPPARLVEPLPSRRAGSTLPEMLRRLGELEVNEVWVEAGATLSGALLAAGLVDELVVYQAASVLGVTARGMFDFPALAELPARPSFICRECGNWVMICDSSTCQPREADQLCSRESSRHWVQWSPSPRHRQGSGSCSGWGHLPPGPSGWVTASPSTGRA